MFDECSIYSTNFLFCHFCYCHYDFFCFFFIFFPLFILVASPQIGEMNEIPDVLLEKGDLPKIVIISVSIVGAVILLINIALVICFMYKKRVKRLRGIFEFDFHFMVEFSGLKYITCMILI